MAETHFLKCIACNSHFEDDKLSACAICGQLLEIDYDLGRRRRPFVRSLSERSPVSVWRYHDLLPVTRRNAVSMGEGGTALVRSQRIAREIGAEHLYFKNEGQNPTGSFKDRGMTVAITKAVSLRVRTVLCASTGNTSASMAAYAARAGLRAIVLIPSGKIPKGKLAQAIMHGAKIVRVAGNFDKALSQARRMAEKNRRLYLVNSLNPYRIEGQKTLAFEIWEQLGHRSPDFVFVPVGNAGNISAIWKGFRELKELELIEHAPRMIGVQAAGAAPLAQAYKSHLEGISPLSHPKTSASAIKIGAPVSWRKALRAVNESNGAILAVSDDAILQAQKHLASSEGIFGEPASAAALAGLLQARRTGLYTRSQMVVCVVTGHGLKDQSVV